MNRNLEKLEDILGFKFKNKDFLRSALVHRSYLNEHKGFVLEHNERLEFLGDAVLELSVTDFLYNNYSEAEGVLTNWRSSLVNGERLAQIAEELGVYNYLYLSRGEAQDTNQKARNYILANAFEAMIGAMYLDQGYDAAEAFVEKYLFPKTEEIMRNKLWRDPKSTLQEKVQEAEGETPYYSVVRETGPDHDKQFIVGVYVKDMLLAQGSGKSKQEAEQDAARNALEEKGW